MGMQVFKNMPFVNESYEDDFERAGDEHGARVHLSLVLGEYGHQELDEVVVEDHDACDGHGETPVPELVLRVELLLLDLDHCHEDIGDGSYCEDEEEAEDAPEQALDVARSDVVPLDLFGVGGSLHGEVLDGLFLLVRLRDVSVGRCQHAVDGFVLVFGRVLVELLFEPVSHFTVFEAHYNCAVIVLRIAVFHLFEDLAQLR